MDNKVKISSPLVVYSHEIEAFFKEGENVNVVFND